MMKFDLTPLMQRGYREVLQPLALAGLAVSICAYFLAGREASFALFRGSVLGLMDTFILMKGVQRAMPYVDEPRKGLAVMRRYRWYRLIAVSSILVLLLKQGNNVALSVIGLLLTHIFLLINLILIAYRLNKVNKEET